MAIGRRNLPRGATFLPMAHVLDNPVLPYGIGQAIALCQGETPGTLVAVPCSATYHGAQFYGFLAAAVISGQPPVLLTGRGTLVAPIVENGIALVPDQPVWLSLSPGKVTQTFPTQGWATNVGLAITTTEMVLLTDARLFQG